MPKLRKPQVPGDSPLLLRFVHRGAGRGNAQSVTEAKMAACSSRREKGPPEAFPCPCPSFPSQGRSQLQQTPPGPKPASGRKWGPRTSICRGHSCARGPQKSLLVPKWVQAGNHLSSRLLGLTSSEPAVGLAISLPMKEPKMEILQPTSLCVHAQSCPTLCHSMDCSSLPGSVHGILQARILEWVAISSSRGSSQPRD